MSVGDLRPLSFRVQNFRNVDDSGPVELDRVTALVGRNESGKSALLQALHKFNPATPTPYKPQIEYPRDRFKAEYRAEKARTIPVCSVTFAIEGELREKVDQISGTPGKPETITYTRHYGGNLAYRLQPDITQISVLSDDVDRALTKLASSARRIKADSEDAEKVEETRVALIKWAATKQEALPGGNLRTDEGRAALAALLREVEAFSQPATANHIETFIDFVKPLWAEAEKLPPDRQIEALCGAELPVFIYFENYGILDSAVYLPRLLEDAKRAPDDPKVRTILAMFKHVQLSAQEMYELGQDPLALARAQGRPPDDDAIRKQQERKELRAIELNAASLDITKRFSDWWQQRRHMIRYHADGDYFRIWVADNRRPGVEIELESRSKGFQWFFSFYLVFLVESDEGHRDAVLLLDEPGIHLHPTAQAELLSFFDTLAEKNQLVYTTHSPFLIDGKRLTRVRAVIETADGRSEVTTNFGPADRDTLFPLQAALGYEMAQTLFQGKRNALVEGMSDMLYSYGFDLILRANGRPGLAGDVYITPSIGTKAIGILASIYIGQGARPLVLLDDDDAGRAKGKDLVKELYKGDAQRVLFLSTAVPGCAEIEDVVGEDLIMKTLGDLLATKVTLTAADRSRASGVVDTIKAWSARTGTALPDGWKLELAWRIVRGWTEGPTSTAKDLLERAEALIAQLNARA